MARKLRYTIASHPVFDQILPVIAFSSWLFWGAELLPDDITIRHGVYTGVATLAGLVLASATFSCTMTYQSSDPLLREMRVRHHDELKRNWTSITLSCLACAVIPVGAIFVDAYQSLWAFGAVIYSAALLIIRFSRSVFWLRKSLFIVDHSDQVRPAEPPPLKKREKEASSPS